VTAAVEDERVKTQQQSPGEVASRSFVDTSLQMTLNVTFEVATLVFRCLHEAALRYLHRVANVDSRRRLRSSADTQLLVTSRSRLVTAGDRSFQFAGPRMWNSLSSAVRAAPSLHAVLQTAAENYFIFALLLLTVT
jgi:hypothetical protein